MQNTSQIRRYVLLRDRAKGSPVRRWSIAPAPRDGAHAAAAPAAARQPSS